MPRTNLRCVVDLKINEVTAPGVWLPSRENVYLSVSLFGQYLTSSQLPAVFPLHIHEKFHFEKTYYTALDLFEVSNYMNDELVIFELVQLSEYTDGAVRLASFSSSVRDFLRPFPSKLSMPLSSEHEVLLSRTIAFPGISPKLDFSTRVLIKESISPELSALEDALEEEKAKRYFRKIHRVPTKRVRSAQGMNTTSHTFSLPCYTPTEEDPPPHYRRPTESSLSRRRSVSVPNIVADIDLSDSADFRPAFVTGRAQGNRNSNATRKEKNSPGSKSSHSNSKSKSSKSQKKKDMKPDSRESKVRPDCKPSSLTPHGHVVGESRSRRPLRVYLSDDEEDGIYISRRCPRPTSTSSRGRSRCVRMRSPPPPLYGDPLGDYALHPPDRVRMMHCFETPVYDMDVRGDPRSRTFIPVY